MEKMLDIHWVMSIKSQQADPYVIHFVGVTTGRSNGPFSNTRCDRMSWAEAYDLVGKIQLGEWDYSVDSYPKQRTKKFATEILGQMKLQIGKWKL